MYYVGNAEFSKMQFNVSYFLQIQMNGILRTQLFNQETFENIYYRENLR